MPCGNAVASVALYRLGMLLGNSQYIQAAEKALQSVAHNINQTPLYAAGFLTLLEAVKNQPCTIIVRGDAPQLDLWREQLALKLSPDQLAFFIPTDAENLPDAIDQKKADGKPTALVCHGFTCQPPVTDLDDLLSGV